MNLNTLSNYSNKKHLNQIDSDDKKTQIKNMYKYKAIVIGDYNVGKTSLVHRLMTNEYDQEISSTIGIDFHSKPFLIHDQLNILQIWDLAGQEKFRSMMPAYFRDSHVAIFVYDCSQTYQKQMNSIETWLNQLQQYCKDIVKLLVCNKIDMIDDPNSFYYRNKKNVFCTDDTNLKYEEDILRDFCTDFDFDAAYMCSSLNNINVKEIFKQAITLCSLKYGYLMSPENNDEVLLLCNPVHSIYTSRTNTNMATDNQKVDLTKTKKICETQNECLC